MRCPRQRCQLAEITLRPGGIEPLAGIGDHKLDAPQSASREAAQELRPELLGLGGADLHT